MSRSSFGSMYWRSLVSGTQLNSRAAPRGRAGYSFWQRYWASLTGVNLPVLHDRSAVLAPGTAPAPASSPVSATPPQLWSAPRLRSIGEWSRLPLVPESAPLLAASGNRVISETTSADGLLDLFVRGPAGSAPWYRLEAVLRRLDAAPAMVSVRYGQADSAQLLLIPLVRPLLGPPSAHVLLVGFRPGTIVEVSGVAPLRRTEAWTASTVATSIRAAVNRSTREAWRQVRETVDDDLRAVIDQALT